MRESDLKAVDASSEEERRTILGERQDPQLSLLPCRSDACLVAKLSKHASVAKETSSSLLHGQCRLGTAV